MDGLYFGLLPPHGKAMILSNDPQYYRPISNLEAEMSEATNMRFVSFAQDLIYDVTSCKVLNPERVDLYILLSNLTGSVELEKCRQTLCYID
jgi:hypothetical protein